LKETIIKIESLVYKYDSNDHEQPIKAVDGISIDIEEGSFTVILGKNGSGKSTIAKNINALLLPSEGLVFVDGFNTAEEDNIWEIRQRAGMVFQNPDNQLVSAIVEDDVAFGPENLGLAPDIIRQRITECLNAVGMWDFRKKAPHMLSGGQKQRIAIAGVIAMRPKCIIFDEPTAMLDPKGREEVMEIIRQLNHEGITIVLITHFMEEASEADRVIMLDQGKIAIDGRPEEVFLKTDLIRSLDLDVPLVVELSERLRKRGRQIPDFARIEDMVTYLCPPAR
jgi:energy-coupling factor transport system ATP-binding protein